MRLLKVLAYTLLLAMTLPGAHQHARAEDRLGLRFSSDSGNFFPDPRVIRPGPRPTNGIDPAMFSLADAAMSTIVSGLQNAISDRLKSFRLNTIAAIQARREPGTQAEQRRAQAFSGPQFAAANMGSWTQVFGLPDANLNTEPFANAPRFSGATIGFDVPLSPTSIAGFFFGGSTGSVTDDSTLKDLSTNGFYSGFYLTHLTGRYFVDLAVSVGLAQQDSNRYDFEISDAEASYSSYFVNPTFTISTYTSVAGQLLLPSVKMSYAGYFFDGYNETGSPQSLTVDDRSSHSLSSRAQITLPFAVTTEAGSIFKMEGYGGVDATLQLGDNKIENSFATKNVAFASDDANREISFILGADLAYTLSNGLLFYSGFEGAINTSGSLEAAAKFGTRFSF